MGEIAEMIMMGFICQQCGMPIEDGDGWGFPRCCDDCEENLKKIEKNKEK
jgi:hypothetical protein